MISDTEVHALRRFQGEGTGHRDLDEIAIGIAVDIRREWARAAEAERGARDAPPWGPVDRRTPWGPVDRRMGPASRRAPRREGT